MATNFVQEGKAMYMVTASGAEAGDAFVVGDFLPGVLLTDADSDDSHKATVATEGVFSLSVNGDTAAVSAGDALYWTDKDTPLHKDSAQKFFGIALEDTTDATAAIDVLINPKTAIPASTNKHNNVALTGAHDTKMEPTTSGFYMLATASGEGAFTMGDPEFEGQKVSITLDVLDTDDLVITFDSPVNDANNDVITMDTEGESAVLVGVDADGAGTLEWRIVASHGTLALSTS